MAIDDNRESGMFDYNLHLEHILSKVGLMDLINDPNNNKPVKVAVTFDGGSVSRFLGHVTGGFKLVDGRYIDPKTGSLLFGEAALIKCNRTFTASLLRFPFPKTQRSFIAWSIKVFLNF